MTAPDPAAPGTAEQPPAVEQQPAPPAAPAQPPAEDPGAALRAQLADAQALAARVPELEQRAASAEDLLTRLRVTRAAGLDDTFAERLRGGDESELTADATALAELLAATRVGPATQAATPPGSAPASAPAAPLPPGRRPVEALRPASAAPPAESTDDDPAAIARLVFGKPTTP
ncbi:hypothetical protein [Lentzea sp. NBRC 102530]|uniref:hypothetical protein n=1 Tax=Lentzea sp. NBRC 102530 TaxID=3032201 RepID=UPI0024A18840|nr:hypothetical protein [Lentzea sp. NBRC 102530]GLY51304.1 hypothetical protein Lesp01_49600 [Lentzea sp. NBRC 102530]